MALLAHDLRTPLSAMRLTAELIGTEPLTEKQAERLDLLIRSIDALSDLTGDLLHADQPAMARSDLAGLIGDIGELYRVAAEARGLEFQMSLEEIGDVPAPGQAGAIRRVITTLVDNAVKYTDDGRIALALSRTSSGYLVSVTDTGPGIDPAEAAQLFRPYVRGTAGKKEIPGTGLGLWGASQLVADLGGTLQLTSPPEGGCRFEVRLPCSGQPAAKERQAAPHPAEIVEPEAHVMVVDDNLTNRRLLSALLESFSITCDLAASGKEALDLFGTADYDSILLDLNMPEMDGLETARRIRTLDAGKAVPIIAVTAALETVGEEQLADAGFNDVLAKPLVPVRLFQALEPARTAFRHRQSDKTA